MVPPKGEGDGAPNAGVLVAPNKLGWLAAPNAGEDAAPNMLGCDGAPNGLGAAPNADVDGAPKAGELAAGVPPKPPAKLGALARPPGEAPPGAACPFLRPACKAWDNADLSVHEKRHNYGSVCIALQYD